MIPAQRIADEVSRLVTKYRTNDPLEIAEREGVLVTFSDEIGRVMGFYSCLLNRPVIVLNSNLSREQLTIIASHELGHACLHRHLVSRDLHRDYVAMNVRHGTEYEANAFAARLLVDRNELMEYIKVYCYPIDQIAAAMNLDPDLIGIYLAEEVRVGRLSSDWVRRIAYDPSYMKRRVPLGDD